MPGRPDDPLDWPVVLRDYVKRYGADYVTVVGMEALGYPPNLATHSFEFKKVLDKFRKGDS